MMPEVYAKTLFESTKDKPHGEIGPIVDRFLALVKRRGHAAILPRIARQLSRLVLEEERKGGAVATFASQEGRETLHQEVKREAVLRGFTGALKERIDETLIGGFQLRVGSAFMDASHKRSLLVLYERLRKAALASSQKAQ